MSGRVGTKLREIEYKRGQVLELHENLDRSLAIEELWPGCFDYGKVSTTVVGGRKDGHKFIIYRGDGSVRSFDIDTVFLDDFELLRKRGRGVNYRLKSDVIPQFLIDACIPEDYR